MNIEFIANDTTIVEAAERGEPIAPNDRLRLLAWRSFSKEWNDTLPAGHTRCSDHRMGGYTLHTPRGRFHLSRKWQEDGAWEEMRAFAARVAAVLGASAPVERARFHRAIVSAFGTGRDGYTKMIHAEQSGNVPPDVAALCGCRSPTWWGQHWGLSIFPKWEIPALD